MSDPIEPTPNPPAPPTDPHAMPEGEEHPPPGTRLMAIVRWALVIAMALAALAAWARYTGAFESGPASGAPASSQYFCPMHPSVTSDQPGECPICGMDLVLREGEGEGGGAVAHEHGAATGFYCPMHPAVTSETPAECPICGMDLVPKAPAGEVGVGQATSDVPGLAPVHLSPERLQLIGMKTAVATREKLAEQLRTVGYVAVDEQRVSVVHARVSGWVEKLQVDQTGAPVRKGQLLAEIYSPELLAGQQELVPLLGAGDAGVPLDDALLADAKQKLLLLGMPPDDLAEFLRTRVPKRGVGVRSPSNGYVSRKAAFEGLYFQPGTQLFEIADLSSVWILADVYEAELARVRVGQQARLELAAYPGRPFHGIVEFLYPALDPATRTLRVRLRFPNPRLALRPGMYGDVHLAIPTGMALVVPREAVVDTGDVQYVFVAREGGRFEPRRVRVGHRSDDKVEIVEGLAEGEVVVTTANFLLDSESRLRATLDASAAPRPAADGGSAPAASPCDALVDRVKFPEKYDQCRACEAHRGMGSMEEDCRNAIPKPWR